MDSYYIGYDIGTKIVKIAYAINGKTEHFRAEHLSVPGEIVRKFNEDFRKLGKPIQGIATGKYRDILGKNSDLALVDWTKPVIRYCKDLLDSEIRYVVDIGAGGLALLEIKNGEFHRFETNSLCASGTGSFLDQQMLRMGLSFEAIDNIKLTARVPSIASRCAVFAKSDLIHRQQEGFSVEELWNGLVKGMAESCFITLLRGADLSGKILMIGGLAKNNLFRHYFSQHLEENSVTVLPEPDMFIAQACCHYAQTNKTKPMIIKSDLNNTNRRYDKPLMVEQADKTEHQNKATFFDDDHGNEIMYYQLCKNSGHDVFFGVDIGSTSTKGVLTDHNSGEILLGLYRKTQGNPIKAYQMLLRGIKSYTETHNVEFRVRGMGTTGSGRKIVGLFAGADVKINEITAHLKGGIRELPDVRTIFEIGGQDSKYIFLEDGWMKDANMNYVCAAGTGSFLEEQALNLNMKISDFEKMCTGMKPPKTNDRCTVFMEQDVKKLLADSCSKREIAASLLYAVCRNYLHRVVQNRPVESPVLFLGATARNRGLVEAFRNILNIDIITSPNSHLTGAIGITEILRHNNQDKTTAFRGFQLDEIKIDFKEKNCGKCHNNCRIIYFNSGEEVVSWGYQCGKEELDAAKKIDLNYFDRASSLLGYAQKKNTVPAEDKRPVIYIPQALSYFNHSYFWHSFWEKLGYRLHDLSKTGPNVVSTALKYGPNDVCYPLKVAVGHVINSLFKEMTPLFVPYTIKEKKNQETTNSYFCPLSQSLPGFVKNIMAYNKIPDNGLLTPTVDFSLTDRQNIDQLSETLGKALAIDRNRIKQAWLFAQKKEDDHEIKLSEESNKTISELQDREQSCLVFMGRGYNLYDDVLNLGLIRDTAKYGYKAIPFDLIPVDRQELDHSYRNMYWSYGQKLIKAAQTINKYPNLYPVFLTNFNCGPDSFLLSALEDIWQEKPYLILELDEHSGNAGYLTRVEAFLDRVKAHRNRIETNKQSVPSIRSGKIQNSVEEYCQTSTCRQKQKENSLHDYSKKGRIPANKEHKLLIPAMQPDGSRFVAAAFRSYGYDAEVLAKEDIDTFQLGKSQMRGSECLPAASTYGSFLHYYNENYDKINKPFTLFMPSAAGPCRFGQYSFLHNLLMERHGLDAQVMTVSSENNYGGIKGGLRLQIVKSFILNDILAKIGCKYRPYEVNTGETDQLLNKYSGYLEQAIEQKDDLSKVLGQLKSDLLKVKTDHNIRKPLVGIVGEIYVRNSPFSNDYLIKKIESFGSEAWLTPTMEWLDYVNHLKKGSTRNVIELLTDNAAAKIMHYYENRYLQALGNILIDRQEPDVAELICKSQPYLTDAIRGEAVLTIGRSISFVEQGAKLIVNVAPFGCMPGAITSTILKTVAHRFNVPIVSLFYDGFTSLDSQLDQYLSNLV